jgi:hypothetical protein
MHARLTGSLAALTLLFLGFGAVPAEAQRAQMLQSAHYRVYYAKEHEATAGEILRLSEAVWPALAKAYDAYDNYQIIDIFLSDRGDFANGSAIYPFSRVEIYLPHMNWVMRGRRNWLGNVLTHELAHVFSLRQKARMWIVSDIVVGGYTFNRSVNYALTLPLIPLAAPNWWIEGIAQFEAEEAGFDVWDSQRDMIVRDAWLTGTLPTLGQIETFDGDWIQAERVYNTGFAFLRHLRERYGIEKVRALAVPKPFFHFGGAVKDVFGKSLPELYGAWKTSLEDRYGHFRKLPEDTEFDKDIQGSFTQSLAFSRDGRTMAWLGNDDREYPLNWIYWKNTDGSLAGRSGGVVSGPDGSRSSPSSHSTSPAQSPTPGIPSGILSFGTPGMAPSGGHPALRPRFNLSAPRAGKAEESPRSPHAPHAPHAHHALGAQGGRSGEIASARSAEIGSAGLEFNHDGTRLLTTRNEWESPYSDIWEYAYRARTSEDEKWHRLTWNERATEASYHPVQPGVIVFSRFHRGSSNVAVLDAGGRIRQLTLFREGQQVYSPRFTPAGDSIYFVLGTGGREAIVALSAAAPAWDAFEALKDSAVFPDSAFIARGESLRFVTPLQEASYRDLRFAGDTLLFSTDGHDSVYNVFARLPGDSILYRLTRGRTQALEPGLRGGSLYYQGYRRQHFGLFRVPVRFEPEVPWPVVTDTLPPVRPKKTDYTKAADVRDPGVKRVAWGISPYVNLSPQFLDDTTFADLNLDVGLVVSLGPVAGGLGQYFGGYMSKRVDASTQLDYGVAYGGQWSGVTAWHQRRGWTPNLGYSVSRDVRHQAFGGVFTGTVTDGVDDYDVTVSVGDRVKYTYDAVQGRTSLPLDGMRIGPGFLGTSWQARYWNQNVLYDESGLERYRNQRTGEEFVFPFSLRILETSLHRHLFQQAGLQWVVPAFGTPLPQYAGFYTSLGQWWTRYSSTEIPTDSIPGGFAQAVGEDRPVALLQSLKADFAPWQVDLGLFGALSWGRHLGLSFQHQTGFFTHKFPAVEGRLARSFGDTVTVSNPHPNLWVMPYRLAFYMPGYPYGFYYRGRDILQGSAMSWTRVQADLPLKLRQYLDHPSPLSSLNKLQLSAIGNAGTVLNTTPDKLVGEVEAGRHYLLMDYGVRLSATFLFYHWLPMDLYFMAFKPYNQLKPGNVYLQEWSGRYARPEDYLQHVKEPRFYMGFTFGGL